MLFLKGDYPVTHALLDKFNITSRNADGRNTIPNLIQLFDIVLAKNKETFEFLVSFVTICRISQCSTRWCRWHCRYSRSFTPTQPLRFAWTCFSTPNSAAKISNLVLMLIQSTCSRGPTRLTMFVCIGKKNFSACFSLLQLCFQYLATTEQVVLTIRLRQSSCWWRHQHPWNCFTRLHFLHVRSLPRW